MNNTRKYYGTEWDYIRIDEKLRVAFSDTHQLLIGLTYDDVSDKYYKAGKSGTQWGKKPTWDDDEISKYYHLAFTINEELTFGKLKAVAGFMYDYTDQHDNVLLPRLTLMYNINDNQYCKIIYGEGFLTPIGNTLNDQLTGPTTSVKGTDDLEPEFLKNVEINYNIVFEKAILTLSAFHAEEEDAIVKTRYIPLPEPFVYTWTNSTGIYKTDGYEAMVEFAINEKIKSYLIYQHYYMKNTNSLWEDTIKFGTNILLLDGKIDLFIYDEYLDDVYAPSDAFGEVDYKGFHVVNVNIRTTKTFNDKMDVALKLYNLLDEKTYVAPDGSSKNQPKRPIPGFNWELRVGYKY